MGWVPPDDDIPVRLPGETREDYVNRIRALNRKRSEIMGWEPPEKPIQLPGESREDYVVRLKAQIEMLDKHIWKNPLENLVWEWDKIVYAIQSLLFGLFVAATLAFGVYKVIRLFLYGDPLL